MWEFEVLWKTGEHRLIQGYCYEDALKRWKIKESEVAALLMQEYVDWPPEIQEVFLSNSLKVDRPAVHHRRGRNFLSRGNCLGLLIKSTSKVALNKAWSVT